MEGVRGQRNASAALYPRKDPVPIVQEAAVCLNGQVLNQTMLLSVCLTELIIPVPS